MLPKAPDSELRKDSNPLIEALYNYQVIHVEAYVVHVDMVSQHEVAFKLTPETIEALVEYHKDIYSVDAAANTWSWPEKDSQLKKNQEEFVQAVNRFVFRTGVRALEGLEEDGAGELLEGRSEDVKHGIMNLFLPLLPPPPRIVDVIAPAPIFPNAVAAGNTWWQPTQMLASHPAPVDSWKVLPSTPSPTATACSDPQSNTFWSSMGLDAVQLPSPTPSFSQPVYTSAGQFYSSPQAVAAVPSLHYPSALPQQCGPSMGNNGFDGFGWNSSSLAPQYAIM